MIRWGRKPLSEQPPQGAVLVDIRREGRLNIFVFSRNGKTFEIETMGMLSDTPDRWRMLAGLTNEAK